MALPLLSGARARTALIRLAIVVALILFVEVVLPGPKGGDRGTPLAVLFGGVVSGSIAGLTAVGLILVYRTNRIINFAQVGIGSAGATLAIYFIRYTPVPFPVAMALGLALAAATGALFDLLFGRRFARSPRLVLTVITVAGAGFLGGQVLQAVDGLPFWPSRGERSPDDFTQADQFRRLLPLPGMRFRIGDTPVEFGFAEVFAIEVVVVLCILVFLFLRFTKAGVAVRALAENQDRASLLGISVGAMSMLVWALAGLLSGAGAMLTAITTTPSSVFAFNPTVLLVPLAAAVLARMRDLAPAMGWAILVSVVTAAVQWTAPERASLVSVILLFALIAGLLAQRRETGRSEVGSASWEAAEEIHPIPVELARIGGIRFARYAIAAILLVAVVVFPFVAGTRQQNLTSLAFINGIVAISLVVLTGWGGQVSLGQFGFVAVGALVCGSLVTKVSVPFWVALPIASVFTGLFAVVLGIPALRIKGLFLAAVTFAFAVAAQNVLFDETYFGWLIPRSVERPTLFFIDFEDEKSMYFLCLAGLVASIAVVLNLRKSRTGRILIAARENEANVQTFGVKLLRTKLLAFLISGALCGLAGGLFAVQQRAVSRQSFAPFASINIFTQTIIGGISSIGGALLGTLFAEIIARYLVRNVIFQILAGLVPLFLLYIAPGGLAGLLARVRDGGLRIVAQRRHLVVPSLFEDFDPEALEHKLVPLAIAEKSVLDNIPPSERFTGRSELFKGKGVRIVDQLAGPKVSGEHAALTAASDSVARSADDDSSPTTPVGANQ